MGPWRDKCRKGIEPGRISIGVGSDVHTRSACSLNLGDHIAHVSPVVLAGDLQVPDLNRDARFAPDANGFVKGSHFGIALTAHMTGVDTAIFGRLFR